MSAVSTGFSYFVDGPRLWFLQRGPNGGIGDELYIHNANIGAFIVYLTMLAGAQTVAAPAMVSAVAFALGLLYAYLFVRDLSGSRPLAFVFLVLLSTSVYFNLVFGLNVIRAWHWLPLFGSAYHLLAASRSPSRRGLQLALYCLYLLMAIVVSYDFLVFAIGLSVALVVFSVRPLRQQIRFGVLVIAASGGVVAIRQLQVIGGVGVATWWTDLVYAAGTKSLIFRALLRLPDAATIQGWYSAHHLARGSPFEANDFGHILFLLGYSEWWVERFGPLCFGLAFAGLITALMSGHRPEWNGGGNAVVVLGFGQLLGLAAFPNNSINYFIARAWPMLISLLCLAIAFCCLLLARRHPWLPLLLAITAAVAVLLMAISEWVVVRLGPARPSLIAKHMPPVVLIATIAACLCLGGLIAFGSKVRSWPYTAPLVLAIVGGYWIVMQIANWQYLQLQPYPWPPELRLNQMAESAPQNIDATFGNQFRLLGYRARSEPALTGRAVDITLYWQCIDQQLIQWQTQVELLDPANGTVLATGADVDQRPRPVTSWLGGEVLPQTYRFVPQPDLEGKDTSFDVIFVNIQTGERLKAVQSSATAGRRGFGSLQLS